MWCTSLLAGESVIDPTTPELVATDISGTAPFISSSSTHATMIWGASGAKVIATVRTEGEWSEPVELAVGIGSDDNVFRVASNSAGSLVVYQYTNSELGDYELRGIYYNAATEEWGSYFIIQDVSNLTSIVDLCGDDDGFGLVWNDANVEADNAVFTSFSSDGLTWSEPAVVSTITLFNLFSIGKNANGYLITFSNAQSFAAPVYSTFSSDEGESWTASSELHSVFHITEYIIYYGPSIFGNSTGFYVVGIDPSEGFPFVTFSEDNGETWDLSVVAEGVYPDFENASVDISGNEDCVVVSMVDDSSSPLYPYVYSSLVDSLNWSDAAVIPLSMTSLRTTASEEELIISQYIVSEGNSYYASYSSFDGSASRTKDVQTFTKRFFFNKPQKRGYISQ